MSEKRRRNGRMKMRGRKERRREKIERNKTED